MAKEDKKKLLDAIERQTRGGILPTKEEMKRDKKMLEKATADIKNWIPKGAIGMLENIKKGVINQMKMEPIKPLIAKDHKLEVAVQTRNDLLKLIDAQERIIKEQGKQHDKMKDLSWLVIGISLAGFIIAFSVLVFTFIL